MRFGRTEYSVGFGVSHTGRALFCAALAIALLLSVFPARAAITGVSPGSATRAPGSSVGVSVTTNIPGGNVAISGSAPGVSVGKSGSAPTFSFSFQVGTSATPGTYSYSFTDGESVGRFSLTVTAPPATTTTTAPATTTTTRRPTTTTTTRAPTTTTTLPATTTTSSTTTTAPATTLPPTTTTSSTTTTTIPPTTTTTTLVPVSVAALGDDSAAPKIPMNWLGGGLAAVALALAAVLLFLRRRPAHAASASGFTIAWRRLSEQRRNSSLGRASRTATIRTWWRTSGPVTSFREWRSGKDAARDLNRRIEERRRLSGD